MSNCLLNSQTNTSPQYINIFLEIAEGEEKQSITQLHQFQELHQSSEDALSMQSNYENTSSAEFTEERENRSSENTKNAQCQKQNIIKNILRGFFVFLLNVKDKSIQDKYCKIYNSQKYIPFTEIRKSLSRKIKAKNNRWNMTLKSILTSNKFCPLFHHFLLTETNSWLLKSRIEDIENHKIQIHFLINLIENGESSSIVTYKKNSKK